MTTFDVNQFFESVDIILTQRLSDLSYDKTVIATIVDDSKKDKGHYVVSDGTIKFDAYSNDDSYKVDDQVRITVLNGDWSQKKFISGKYSDKDSVYTAVKYMAPLETTMQDSQSKISNTNASYTLLTNNSAMQSIWSMKITPDDKYYALQANGIYNVLTLQGDFCTDDMGDISAGNYGLLLELFITKDGDNSKRIRQFMTFDSSEMLGNPFSFIIDSRQSKQFVMAMESGIVTEIILSIYQGTQFDVSSDGKTLMSTTNLFKDYSGNRVDNKQIHFKNIAVGFGSDLTQIEDNKLQIYTLSSPTYHYNDGVGDETNIKQMGLVWYNKTDDNRYTGFSDGYEDLAYDELQYLKEKWADIRLINQKNKGNLPTNETSLALAANIEEAEPIMTKIYSMLTTDLSQVLQAIGRSMGGTELKEDIDRLVSAHNGQEAFLVQKQKAAKQATQNLVKLYKEVLQYGYNVQNNVGDQSWNSSWSNTNYFTQFTEVINDVHEELKLEFLVKFESLTASNALLSGYRGVYDSYAPKLNNVLTTLFELVSSVVHTTKVNGQEQEDELLLSQFKNKSQSHFSPAYAEPDLSNYENKYCIYWYRYNPSYKIEDTESLDYRFGQFLGDSWERVTCSIPTENNPNTICNFGAPTTSGRTETIDGKSRTFYPASPVSEQLLSRKMEPTFAEERYQAVLFYNHNMFKSNVITFTNTEADLIPIEFNVDANDILEIEHGGHSQDHYQSYTSAFDLVNIADESRSRDLRVSYKGVLSGDETLAGADIYWYIPINSTMLTYDINYLTNETNGLGFTSDALSGIELTLSGDKDAVTYTYDETLAESIGLLNATINNITIVGWDKNNDTITLERTLNSSSNCNQVKYKINHVTNKTIYSKDGYVYFYKKIDYTSELKDACDIDGNPIFNADGSRAKNEEILINEQDRHFAYKIKPFYEASAQNNSILVEAHVHGKNGETKITKGEIFFTFSTFGTNGTKYTFTLTPTTSQIAVVPQKPLNMNLALRNAENELIPLSYDPVANPSGNPASPNTYGLAVQWYAKSSADNGIGVNEISGSDMKLVSVGDSVDGEKYAGIVEAKVSYQADGKSTTTPRVITLSALAPIPYTTNENYYISGPTTIVYNNQGTISRLSEEPFRLYNRYPGTNETELIDGQTWNLLYYDNKGRPVTDLNIIKYLPKLNDDNTLMPAPMYYSYDSQTEKLFYVPVAQCKIGNNVVWTQPIIITQNQYASSTLNDWNGQFEINAENGTILSTMVGAGRKTENNTFEGVLIGDIEAGANFDTYNANGLGIYGFNDGAQSFYFGVNGKAFLGKSNSGRIIFDGNDGLIYSGNWLSSFAKNADGTYEVSPFKTLKGGNRGLNPGKAGLAIDLQEGHIDAYNFKVTSNNIYLNSNPDDGGYYFRIGNNGEQIDDSHTDEAERDAQKNGQSSRGYLSFSKDGALDIRVNSLSITGQLGGINLLEQTEPKRTIPTYKTSGEYTVPNVVEGSPRFDWNVAKKGDYTKYTLHQQSLGLATMEANAWNALYCPWNTDCDLAGSYTATGSKWAKDYWNDDKIGDKQYYIAVTSSGSSKREISQTIEVQENEYYTVSGYVHNTPAASSSALTINFTPADSITIPQWSIGHNTATVGPQWEKFEHTIKTGSGVTSITITFSCDTDFALWHAKLESGTISSAWSPAPTDTEDSINSSQNKYNIYLSQDVIFDKLTTDDNGQKMVGIWLLPGYDSASGHNELYINATYMSTGILRSSNWKGEIESITKTDSNGNTIHTYKIKTPPTAGLYLNLDEGKMWAANFELNAGNDSTGDTGLYLNSSPENSQRWFYVGDKNNHISFAKDSSGVSSLSLKMQGNYTLETTGTNAIYFSNTSKSITGITGAETTDKFVLAVGTNFAVTDTGKLYIKGARVDGSIYATSGEIGGWYIGTNALTSKAKTGETPTISLDGSTGTITGGTVSGAKISGGKIVGSAIYAQTLDIGSYTEGTVGSGAFSVDQNGNLTIKDSNTFYVSNSGALTATSATIGGWKVTSSTSGFSYGSGTSALIVSPTTGLSFGDSGVFSVGADGVTKIKDLVVDTSFKVKKKRDGDIVLSADSSGNLSFNGNITLGKDQKSGYTGGIQDSDTNGYATIEIDTPWSLKTGKATFYNGILCGWETVSSSIGDIFESLFGSDDKDDYGSSTRPVYVKDGKFKPMSRGTAGQLFMGQGSTKDPAWTTVTGFTNDAANRKFGLDLDTNNKLYVQLPIFSSAGAGLAPASGKTANAKNFLCEDGSWKKVAVGEAITFKRNGTTLCTYDGSSAGSLDFGSLAFANDIKKKFNLTVSGTVANTDHSYYVESGSQTYIEQGAADGCWKEAGAIWTQEVENYTGWAITTSQKTKFHYDSTTWVDYYKAGTEKSYKTYKKAGNLSVKVVGSTDVTLEPSTDATSSISVSATGGTVTIS